MGLLYDHIKKDQKKRYDDFYEENIISHDLWYIEKHKIEVNYKKVPERVFKIGKKLLYSKLPWYYKVVPTEMVLDKLVKN